MGWDDNSFYTGLAQQTATATERTLVDKVVARRNVEKIESLLRKEEWTREDLKLLLNHLVSDELKLLYFRDWDRYILGKYFVWLREIVRIGEHYYDVEERIRDQERNVDRRTQRLQALKRIEKQLISSIQFAADVFLYLARSSLSIYGKAFDTLLKNRVEYEYRSTSEPHVPDFENYLKGVSK